MAIYLEEIVAIDRGGKEAYLESVHTRLAPHLERTRGMRLVWLGSTIGSTGAWPETVEIWELADWRQWADACARMSAGSGGDAELEAWWRDAARLRLRSRSRTLVPASFSPTLDELRARDVRGAAFAFTTWKTRPGRAGALLAALEPLTAEEAARGRRLVGAFEVAFTNDTATAVWAHEELPGITRYEAGLGADPGRARVWRSLAENVERWSEHWGFAVPGTPLALAAGGAKVW